MQSEHHHLDEATPVPQRDVVHVQVGDDGAVQVEGVTAHDIVALLHGDGNRVAITGGLAAKHEPAPVKDVGLLTDREAEIITLVATGLTNSEVADTMFLSINTVKTYIRSAYRKMDVDSRSQAVIWAIDHALVDPHPQRASLRGTPSGAAPPPTTSPERPTTSRAPRRA